MSAKTKAERMRELMVAGDRRDWDEVSRLEAKGHEFREEEMETGVCVECGNPPEAHVPEVEVLERRWVARRRVVFEDIGVDKWFEIWFDPEVNGFVLEETPGSCELCEYWNPKIDLDAETLGVCWGPNAERRSDYTEHDYGCAEWRGSDRPPKRTAT